MREIIKLNQDIKKTVSLIIICSVLSVLSALIGIYFKIFSIATIVFFVLSISMVGLSFIIKEKFEKVLITIFILCIPFITDLNIVFREDYHVASKEYYRFNILQVFALVFFIQILKNIKKIKLNLDLLLIFAFNLSCIASIFYSINPKAAFFDCIRYICITIVYIYFSRMVDYRKYKTLINNCLIYGVIFQLIIGLIQKIKGGPLGLYFLGEGRTVFRLNVTGYELGLSGTFNHPGPYAIYALIVLCWIVFDENSVESKRLRNIGIICCTLMIILAAGRTTMLLMVFAYSIKILYDVKQFNTKAILSLVVIGLFGIVLLIVFSENIMVILGRFSDSDFSMQLNSRLIHVELATKYIKESPILGAGINNYLDLTFRDYPMTFYSNFFLNTPIHNAYLLYWVEIGVVGMGLYILLILKNFIYKFKCRKSKKHIYQIRGYLVSIIMYIIYNFQGWGGVQNRTLIMIMLASAVIYYNYNDATKNNDFILGA